MPCKTYLDKMSEEYALHKRGFPIASRSKKLDRTIKRSLIERCSVQNAIAAVNVEVHRHFDRSASSGLKPPLQESFGSQFVQVFVATAFYDFDFIHFAALWIYCKPKTTFALGHVQDEAGRIFGFDLLD